MQTSIKTGNRSAHEWLKERDTLFKLIDDNYTVTECANVYGVKVATMAAIFNALGLRTAHDKLRDELTELAAKQREVK